ncbi:MAG: 30S ribosomal protein S16 [Legionellales bacterium RIFCSPHIGHO2_12_FULL_37_14]|nr:MAG: 30S ribosomal protein S16 [Legionellales bacterium RIFCSPHIGHO2_12_FULL_37_14]
MVVIRLARAGTNKRPFYHVVVTDKRRRRDSNSIECVGYFNPIAKGQDIRLHLDVNKINYWKSVGAQLSDRVTQLFSSYSKGAAEAVNG